MSDNGGEFFFGFVVGALAGAAAALLLAPASGEDLRGQIGEKGLELKGQVEKLADDAKIQAQRLAETSKQQTGQLAGDARGQVEHLQERGRIVLSDNVRKAQQAVQDAQTKLNKPEQATS